MGLFRRRFDPELLDRLEALRESLYWQTVDSSPMALAAAGTSTDALMQLHSLAWSSVLQHGRLDLLAPLDTAEGVLMAHEAMLMVAFGERQGGDVGSMVDALLAQRRAAGIFG